MAGKNFTFTHEGKSYTFERPLDSVKRAGWLRKHRNRSEVDLVFTLLEEVAGEDALAAIDEMPVDGPEFKALAERLNKVLTGE